MTVRPLLPGAPLTPEHARQLDSLVNTLTPEEALWISGYLARFAQQSGHREAEAPAAGPASLLILYGSETGHAAKLAAHGLQQAQAKGLAASSMDMADFQSRDLHNVHYLLVFTSTHGDGDPPGAAADFVEFLQSRKAPRLEGMKFAVLGLGDSSYAHFCQTGKEVDQRLEALGARRIQARFDGDVDYEKPAAEWIDAVLAAFAREMPAAGTETPSATPQPARAAGTGTTFDEKHPFPAVVLASLKLNGRGSDKETRHIELSLAGSGLAWEPGDSLGVLPENAPARVAELLSALGLKADEMVPDGEGDTPLAQALARRYDITSLTPSFIARYGEASSAGTLGGLAEPGREADLRRYMADRQIIDVVTEFPAPWLGGRRFIAMLRSLQPRLYSLASSYAAYPDEAHLTVAVVRYQSHGRQRQGVASAFLSAGRGIDESVPVHIASNKNFRLPADDSAPILMIGAGTGVAPFRAFLQEREVRGARGRNWLFFGDRRFRTDFLYQTEWQHLLKTGLLTRMDVAFSRDQEEKVYVQHRLLARSREVFAWLEEGASLYVCGDAAHLAPDVHGALTAIVAREGGLGEAKAKDYLKQLQKAKRYQRDVY